MPISYKINSRWLFSISNKPFIMFSSSYLARRTLRSLAVEFRPKLSKISVGDDVLRDTGAINEMQT